MVLNNNQTCTKSNYFVSTFKSRYVFALCSRLMCTYSTLFYYEPVLTYLYLFNFTLNSKSLELFLSFFQLNLKLHLDLRVRLRHALIQRIGVSALPYEKPLLYCLCCTLTNVELTSRMKNKGNKHTGNQYGNPIYKSLYLHPISNLAYKYYLIPKPICARP